MEALETLRHRIRALERPHARAAGVLPFGVAAMDACLPEDGLAMGALHEVTGSGAEAGCAALFAAGILARHSATLNRPVLWCATTRDIFAPGLAGAGLHPDRVMYAAAASEKQVLLVMEEALRHPGLAAVLGELTRLPMTASRRLVLAAEKSGVMALVLRRQKPGRAEEGRPKEGREEDTGLTAASTRWRIGPQPAPASLVPGMPRARWLVELTRCRGGEPQNWMMEACDAQGCLAVPAELAHRPAAQERAA